MKKYHQIDERNRLEIDVDGRRKEWNQVRIIPQRWDDMFDLWTPDYRWEKEVELSREERHRVVIELGRDFCDRDAWHNLYMEASLCVCAKLRGIKTDANHNSQKN